MEESGRLQSMGSLRVATEWLHFHFSLSYIGEGNGNPLQCYCLENPRDRGAWWAAVYGVTQSRTRLKWLSSRLSSSEIWMMISHFLFKMGYAIFPNIWLLMYRHEVFFHRGFIQCYHRSYLDISNCMYLRLSHSSCWLQLYSVLEALWAVISVSCGLQNPGKQLMNLP